MAMWGNTYKAIGKIVDYQVPLKSRRDKENKGLGKIDLLSHNGDSLIMLELKRFENKETLLRTVLEIYTYWKIVDRTKLLSDYNDLQTNRVEKGVLVYKNSPLHLQIQDAQVARLMQALDVKAYVISGDVPETYTVVLDP